MKGSLRETQSSLLLCRQDKGFLILFLTCSENQAISEGHSTQAKDPWIQAKYCRLMRVCLCVYFCIYLSLTLRTLYWYSVNIMSILETEQHTRWHELKLELWRANSANFLAMTGHSRSFWFRTPIFHLCGAELKTFEPPTSCLGWGEWSPSMHSLWSWFAVGIYLLAAGVLMLDSTFI